MPKPTPPMPQNVKLATPNSSPKKEFVPDVQPTVTNVLTRPLVPSVPQEPFFLKEPVLPLAQKEKEPPLKETVSLVPQTVLNVQKKENVTSVPPLFTLTYPTKPVQPVLPTVVLVTSLVNVPPVPMDIKLRPTEPVKNGDSGINGGTGFGLSYWDSCCWLFFGRSVLCYPLQRLTTTILHTLIQPWSNITEYPNNINPMRLY